MAKLTDLEKAITDLDKKVNDLLITRTFEQKTIDELDKKVELLIAQVAQHTFTIRLQTFLAAVLITAFITAIFKYL